MQFSVLMSVYASDKMEYFSMAAESIYDNQKLKPSEIVIVIDGPIANELRSKIQEFSKNRPVKIRELNQNIGLGLALKAGLEVCSNEIVARMDSDDISFPDRFEKQIKFHLSNPDVDIWGGQIIEFAENPSNIVGNRKVPFTNEQIRKFAKKRSPFNHPTVMFKKTIIEKSGGYQDFRFLEDYHLWLRIISNNFICANLRDNLLLFRMNGDVIGRRQGFFYFKQEIKLASLSKNLGVTSFFEFSRNISTRGLMRLFPKQILRIFYPLLRKII